MFSNTRETAFVRLWLAGRLVESRFFRSRRFQLHKFHLVAKLEVAYVLNSDSACFLAMERLSTESPRS